MKPIILKKILSEIMKESSQDSANFTAYINIDPIKMGKKLPEQEDVKVNVVAHGYYQDNRFDHEFGTHDPGSGFIAEELKIYAADDVKVYDGDGNETSEILFKKKEEIDENFITEESLRNLLDTAADELTKNAGYQADNNRD
jgi:hypothetical protein